ncbi:MAG: tRNA-(ms[2]io[6]A)-hydroxylase [Planctomycetota bacterium]|nr:tRNA-(ms[2]io[6]A)-hydroxylase [Planctomycetota bacterium]
MTLINNLPKNSIEGLPLLVATPDSWAEAAIEDIGELLADHAHCEMKAAATGFRLLGSYPDRDDLVEAMASLVREEMRHFERVRELLLERGLKLGKPRPDRYVKRLLSESHRGSNPGLQLIEKLIVCAFVEARSCERFRVLARAKLPESLAQFYAELALAEDRHHETFLDLARLYSEDDIEERIARVSKIEADIIQSLPPLSAIH